MRPIRSPLARFAIRLGRVFLWSAPLVACNATPTTFELSQAQPGVGYSTYDLRFEPLANDPEFGGALKAEYEGGLKDLLASDGNLRPLGDKVPDSGTLVLRYRAAGLAEGSVAIRAGTAAVNYFLPVGVVPEIGGGDLGIEMTCLDAGGVVVGRLLVQASVRGLLSTDAGTMRKIGRQTGEYVAQRFGTLVAEAGDKPTEVRVAPGSLPSTRDKARDALAVLEPLLGEWEMCYEIEWPGAAPLKTRVRETSRFEASGRVLLQTAEALDAPEPMFRCGAIVWDPTSRGLQRFAIDSVFGAHASLSLSFERSGTTLRAVAQEKEQVAEFVDVFSEDGKSRKGTVTIWTADRKRLILTIKVSGTKRT